MPEIEEVEIATTQRFKVKLKGQRTRKRGLSYDDLVKLKAAAERGELSDDIKPRFVSATIRRRYDGYHALIFELRRPF